MYGTKFLLTRCENGDKVLHAHYVTLGVREMSIFAPADIKCTPSHRQTIRYKFRKKRKRNIRTSRKRTETLCPAFNFKKCISPLREMIGDRLKKKRKIRSSRRPTGCPGNLSIRLSRGRAHMSNVRPNGTFSFSLPLEQVLQ